MRGHKLHPIYRMYRTYKKPLLSVLAGGTVLTAAMSAATPAHAWKPKTHIFLAEQALKDATADGKVTIYETDYRTGKVIGTLGQFPVDPRVLAALRANPKQYRAGVLGPDAYPDILTGQCLIHPHQAKALDGQIANGTNSWLQNLYTLSYGPVQLYTQTPIRAFTIGYLSHAAGDLFAHTFMNNFSGGEFMITPDPRNAIKHLVLEGYIGKRTPLTIDSFGTNSSLSLENAALAYPGSSFPSASVAELKKRGLPINLTNTVAVARDMEGTFVTENDVSIDGVETFIASEMTFGRPNSVLYDRLLNVDERKKSLPFIFSTLRNSLQVEVDNYNKKSTAGKAAYTVTHPGRITFIEHWIKDIDKGLAQWPKTSHELGKALVYNETKGGADLDRAREVLHDYVRNYLVYMGPVPDIAVDALKFMGDIMDALVPDFIKEAIDDMVHDFENWVAKQVTGKTFDEWGEYLSNPQVHFDPIMNAPGGARPGRNAQQVTLLEMNRDYLKLQDTGYSDGTTETFKIEQFPPAFNTVQMCKMLLLSKDGVNQLLDALVAHGARRPVLPANFENVMLGWHQSLDNDNQWQGLSSRDSNPNAKLIFTQDGGSTYQHLFMKQVGEVDWVTAPAPGSTTPAETTPITPHAPPPGVGTGPSTPTPTTPVPTTPPATDPVPPVTTPTPTTPPATTPPPPTNSGNTGIVPSKPGVGMIGDGKFYSLDQFDIRLDKIQRGRGDVVELFATFKYRGPTRGGVMASTIEIGLADTDGVSIRTDGNLYRTSGDDPVKLSGYIWLYPGEEGRARYLFHLPEGVTAVKKLTAQESGTRIRTFDLSSVTLSAPE